MHYVKIDGKNHRSSVLKATYWNARSVANKTVSLYDYLSCNNCDILVLTETWLRKIDDDDLDENKVTLAKLIPDGFVLKHTPRPDGRSGGGVGIILADTISTKTQSCFAKRCFKQFGVDVHPV